MDTLLAEDNFDTQTKVHVDWMKKELGVDQLLCWGMHGDGIPCNYDRTESVAMVSLNLPGLDGRNGRMRIPLIILPDWSAGEHTWDDINSVFAWDMRHSIAGARPTCRHDGSAWQASDKARKTKETVPIKIRSCLCLIRADLDWMGKVFHFPFHNVKEGCCWLCRCKRKDVRNVLLATIRLLNACITFASDLQYVESS